MVDLIEARSGTFSKGNKSAQHCSKLLKTCSILPKNHSTLLKMRKTAQNCSKLLKPACSWSVWWCLWKTWARCFFLRWLTIICWPVAPLESVFLSSSFCWRQRWHGSILAEQNHHMNFGYFWVFNPAGSNTFGSEPWNDLSDIEWICLRV